MTWLLGQHVEVLGRTYPARKDGSRFYLPVDCPVAVGTQLRLDAGGALRRILDVKQIPHAVIVDTEEVR